MASPEEWQAELVDVHPPARLTYLNTHSGLPGPRANTSLLLAVARIADETLIRALLESDDEFPVMCAAAANAYRANAEPFLSAAHRLAADARWRVREGVAIGLQLLGDTAPSALISIVLSWADDRDPLVQRAAVAAICEPRLLHTAASAAVAIEVCQRTTTHLQSVSVDDRALFAVRTLRQALGYCWSVAVAAVTSR